LAPESIGDVDEIDASDDERNQRDSTYRNKPSSDELNIPSPSLSNVDVQTSKYGFPVAENLVPDGDATRWVESHFGDLKQESPEHDSIRGYTPEPASVKDKVARYEKRSAGPKLNLSKFQFKGGKAKKMQPKVRNAHILFILFIRQA